MKKIISSKFHLVLGCIVTVFCILFSIFALWYDISGIVQKEEVGGGFFWSFVFLAFALVAFLSRNKNACVVWVEDGVLKRKGLFFGFYKECRIEDILTVKIVNVFRSGRFVCIIDDPKYKFDVIKTSRYINFKKTKKNMEFLRTFYNGEIEKE